LSALPVTQLSGEHGFVTLIRRHRDSARRARLAASATHKTPPTVNAARL
jgi:hypothetical protein